MFASGPVILSALFLIQAEAQFEAGARIESRVGEAPTGTKLVSSLDPSGQPVTTTVATEQAQILVVATPILSLRWLGGVDDVRANSATRMLWRPVPLIGSRPLFLETLEATHIRRPSKRSRWQLNVRGTYGEEDYTSLTQQFANQPTLPAATTVVMVNALADALWRSSRRTTLTVQLGAAHRRALDGQTGASGTSATSSTVFVLPTQTSVTAAPGLRYALARRSSLEAYAIIADVDIQGISPGTAQAGRMNVLSLQPQVGILEELTRRHQLRLVAGFTYASALRRTDTGLVGNPPWHPITPLLQIDLNSLLQRTRTAVVRSSLGAGTTWFVDPVLGVAVLRGIAQARLDAALGPNWSVGARCGFATDLTERLPAVGGISPDETVVSAEIPIRYRWTSQLVAEFGGRYAERAPHLSAPDFSWHNRELWLFFTLLTTTRPSSVRS